MAKLTTAERSTISKRTWRARKQAGGKATCHFCGKAIYAQGVVMGTRTFHKGCSEAKGAGLKPAQVGLNPVRKIPVTSALIGHYAGYPPKPYFAGLERGLAVLREKEFKEWSDAERYAQKLASETGLPIKDLTKWNPRQIEDRRKRALRDAFRYFGARPLNPITGSYKTRTGFGRWGTVLVYKCPKCGEETRQIKGWRGPAPRGAFVCNKCGYAIDIATGMNPKARELIFGPTGFRPPAKWFSKIAESAAAGYFGKKVMDLTTAQRARIGRIVGGIWAKMSPQVRLEVLKKYEPSAVRANPTKTTYPSYGGYFQTLKEAQERAKLRERYGYAVKIEPKETIFEGKTYRGYELRESQRPARHTWWKEHLMGESPEKYLARMKGKGIKASIANPKV